MKATALFFTALMIASVHQILSGETSGDWEYTVTDNQATITGYSGENDGEKWSSEFSIDDWWSSFDREPLLRSKAVEKIIRGNGNLHWCLTDLRTPTKLDTTLADIVENDLGEDSSLWWSDEKAAKLFNQMSDSHRNVLLELSRRSSYSYATVFKRMRRGKSMAEVRSDGIAGCLRTPRRGSSRQILIRAGFGNWKVRLLTPREYARLQGVRDSFKLPTNANKGYFAMGDAVCVPVIEYLSEHVLLPLYNRIVASNQSCTSRSLLPT